MRSEVDTVFGVLFIFFCKSFSSSQGKKNHRVWIIFIDPTKTHEDQNICLLRFNTDFTGINSFKKTEYRNK